MREEGLLFPAFKRDVVTAQPFLAVWIGTNKGMPMRGILMKSRTAAKHILAVAGLFAFATAAGAENSPGPSRAEARDLYGSDVTAMAVRKDEVFLLSRQDAPTLKVLAVRTGKSLDKAIVLVPARSDRILESVHPALDAIYVVAREGANARLLRIPVRANGGAEIGFTQEFAYRCRNCRSFPAQRYNRILEIPLPYAGDVSEAHSDPRAPGITVALESGASGKVTLTYDPSLSRFVTRKAENRT